VFQELNKYIRNPQPYPRIVPSIHIGQVFALGRTIRIPSASADGAYEKRSSDLTHRKAYFLPDRSYVPQGIPRNKRSRYGRSRRTAAAGTWTDRFQTN